jgi:hypothetical protein
MKKYSKFHGLILVLSFLFVECSKNADPAPPSIIGTWKAISTSITGCNINTNNKAEITCTSNCTQITFTNNNVTIIDTGSSPITGSYTASSPTLTVTIPGQTLVYTFSVTATTLTLTYIPASLNGGANTDPGCLATTKATRQ